MYPVPNLRNCSWINPKVVQLLFEAVLDRNGYRHLPILITGGGVISFTAVHQRIMSHYYSQLPVVLFFP